jgi:hypothetical protein
MAAREPRTYCDCQDNCGCLLASHIVSPLTYCVNTPGPTRSSKIVATGRSAWDAHLPTVLWDAASPGRFAIELVTSMGRRITVTTDLTRHATSPSPHQPTPKRARPYNLVSHTPVAQPTPLPCVEPRPGTTEVFLCLPRPASPQQSHPQRTPEARRRSRSRDRHTHSSARRRSPEPQSRRPQGHSNPSANRGRQDEPHAITDPRSAAASV